MSLFKLLSNTVEGVIQAPLGAVKTVAGLAVAPLDIGETMLEGTDEVKHGIRKIGNAGDREKGKADD